MGDAKRRSIIEPLIKEPKIISNEEKISEMVNSFGTQQRTSVALQNVLATAFVQPNVYACEQLALTIFQYLHELGYSVNVNTYDFDKEGLKHSDIHIIIWCPNGNDGAHYLRVENYNDDDGLQFSSYMETCSFNDFDLPFNWHSAKEAFNLLIEFPSASNHICKFEDEMLEDF